MGHVALLGPFSRRIFGGANVVSLPELRDFPCVDSICQRSLDERWGLPSVTDDPESLLEVRLPLH